MGWATALSAGPANEAGQSLSFLVSNDYNPLFTSQPVIDPAGNLSFTSASNVRAFATVTVQLHDSGGTANGGQNLSAAQTFKITADDGLDFDGDGFTDLQEFQAGTNTQNPADAPGIVVIDQSANDVIVRFMTVVGKTYRIESNDTAPVNGPWTIVADNVAGTGGTIAVTDSNGAAVALRLYRVQVLP